MLGRTRDCGVVSTLPWFWKAAVAAKDYKEAGQVSRQMKEMERRQQEVRHRI